MRKHRGRGVSHEGRERERSEDREEGWRQMSGHVDRQDRWGHCHGGMEDGGTEEDPVG